MNAPEFFEMVEDYACYRPVKIVSVEEGIDLLGDVIAYARGHRIPRLLMDTRQLTGFPPLDTWERYRLGKRCADEAEGSVVIALIAHEEMIDPQRFAITVARNRGVIADIFVAEAEALTWLLNQDVA